MQCIIYVILQTWAVFSRSLPSSAYSAYVNSVSMTLNKRLEAIRGKHGFVILFGSEFFG